MPHFFSDALDSLWSIWYAAIASWDSLTPVSRILVAIGMTAVAIYGGSRTETSGISMVLFFCAFAFFAYVVTAGYALMQ